MSLFQFFQYSSSPNILYLYIPHRHNIKHNCHYKRNGIKNIFLLKVYPIIFPCEMQATTTAAINVALEDLVFIPTGISCTGILIKECTISKTI